MARDKLTREEQRRMVEAGEGFFGPEVPPYEDIASALQLHCQAREKWDEAPELGVLLSAYGGHLSTYMLPIPEQSWKSYDTPVRLLTRLKTLLWDQGRTDHALVRNIDRPVLTDMVGMYMRYEAFAPPLEKDRQVSAEFMRGESSGYCPTRDPGRREVRCITGVTVDGTMHMVSQYRDTPDRFSTLYVTAEGKHRGNHPVIVEATADLATLLHQIGLGLVRHLRPAHANTPREDD